MEIPLIVNLDIQKFSGSGVTKYNTGLTNCVVHEQNGKLELTQRPSIDVTEDATLIAGLNDRGRGIYYWEVNDKIYIVHDGSVYEDSQASTRITENTGTFDPGSDRCAILETIGVPRLVILDAENNKGWTLSAALSLDLITSNFPSTLTQGGAILDGSLIVMDEAGNIFNSEPDEPNNFLATSFVKAERENDKGVYLGKHANHITAFNTRTLEFFYNARNTSGSILNRREDIMYNVGCADGLGVWENGDITYFVGSNRTGEIAVYKLENFQLSVISPDTMNSYLTQGLTNESLRVVINGMSTMGSDTVIMTIYTLTGAAPGSISPKITFTYNTKSQLWGFWHTTIHNLNVFPLIAWTKRTGGQNSTESARSGEGIFHNGDIVNVNDRLMPVDTLLGGTGVYEAGIYEADIYVGAASDVGNNIEAIIRTGLVDGKIRDFKFQNSEYLMMEKTENTQTMLVRHSDEEVDNFNAGRPIDVSQARKENYSGGRFVKRNYQLEYSGNEQFFLEGFGADLEAGD